MQIVEPEFKKVGIVTPEHKLFGGKSRYVIITGIDFDCHLTAYSDFVDEFYSLDNFNTTIMNGYLVASGGYMKTMTGELTKSGYSRIARIVGVEPQYCEYVYCKASGVIFKNYFSGSDFAIGLSLENRKGSTAYRGDCALWLDGNRMYHFYRETRTSPAISVFLRNFVVELNKVYDFELYYYYSTSQIKYIVTCENQVVYSSGLLYAPRYNEIVYLVVGGRHSPNGVNLTEFWVDTLVEEDRYLTLKESVEGRDTETIYYGTEFIATNKSVPVVEGEHKSVPVISAETKEVGSL